MVLNRNQLSHNQLGFVSLQPQLNCKVGHIPEWHAAVGQAAGLVVFPTGCAMVSRSPYYQPSSLQFFTRYPVMVDVDKHACRTLAEKGYCNGLWLESYVTWDFLDEYPKAMESGYLFLDWDHIPGMYLRKVYMRILVIEKEEWDHLSDPANLAQYWEPTQAPSDFHRTFGLAFCRTAFHDCEDSSQKKEFVVLVAVVRKPAWYVGLPFSTAADEFWDDVEATPTLLLVRLHWHSQNVSGHLF